MTLRLPAGPLDAENAGRIDLLADAYVVHDKTLMENPAHVLSSVERARGEHRVVAVDDVGARPQSLSLLPLIEPDIIVLAPELAGSTPDCAAARTLHVLAAQAERTGAVIVARGVDSEMHRVRALSFGAKFGIGELYPPIAGPNDACASLNTGPTWSTPPSEAKSPFEIASAEQTSIVSSKRLLIEMSTQIEAQASNAGADTLTLGTFQHARQFKTGTRRRWRALADRIAYTRVYGVGMGEMTDTRIVHCSVDPADPLVDEWNIVVLGQFFCCVLSARDLYSGEAELERRFEYVVSHDRGTVVRCARAVLSRYDA
ncbi:MAG: DICT sensory domain-containing protein [Rhodococcus sp. (in: high G+C Gram-positive bacteria)]